MAGNDWNVTVGDSWVVPVFMVRMWHFGPYFADNQGVTEGRGLTTRTKIL